MAARLIALILPLGLDTFALSAALGALGISSTQRLRISVLFTTFEAVMPLVGLALGVPLGRAIGNAADYVAAGVLVVFGLYTMLRGEEAEEERLRQFVHPCGAGALLLGLSISVDELAIGFTLGLLRLPTGLVIVLIAVQAFILAQLGLRLGSRLSENLREGAERLAGVALVILGLVLLGERLAS